MKRGLSHEKDLFYPFGCTGKALLIQEAGLFIKSYQPYSGAISSVWRLTSSAKRPLAAINSS